MTPEAAHLHAKFGPVPPSPLRTARILLGQSVMIVALLAAVRPSFVLRFDRHHESVLAWPLLALVVAVSAACTCQVHAHGTFTDPALF